MVRSVVLALGCVFLILWAGCTSSSAPETAALQGAEEALTLQYAEGFTLSALRQAPAGTYLLEVNRPWAGATDTLRYVLLPRGETPPPGAVDAVIETPVQSMISLSTTHLSMLDRLSVVDRLVGVSGAEWVSTPSVRARIDSGQVLDLGPPERLNVEQVLALRPDVVVTSSSAPQGLMERLGPFDVPVMVNAEYLEATPLGQAEWIIVLGALTGRLQEAQHLFEDIATRYEALTAMTQSIPPEERPTTFLNASWRGTWFVAGGESFSARFLDDAGARYLWADTPGRASVPMDVESVYDRAATADVWLNPGGYASLAAMQDADPRYARFKAWQEGSVYNNDRRLTPAGGNDYWESGVARPDLILADLVKIFHPGLVPSHAWVYYRPLPTTTDRGRP